MFTHLLVQWVEHNRCTFTKKRKNEASQTEGVFWYVMRCVIVYCHCQTLLLLIFVWTNPLSSWIMYGTWQKCFCNTPCHLLCVSHCTLLLLAHFDSSWMLTDIQPGHEQGCDTSILGCHGKSNNWQGQGDN